MSNTSGVIMRKDLLGEVERVYSDHYKQSYDQAIHDFCNAVKRRIRRYCPDEAVPMKKYNELMYKYNRLFEAATNLDTALRTYQKKYGEFEVVKHGTWVEVDDGVLIGTGTHLECSECGTWVSRYQRGLYCAHCGAKMDEGC